MGICFFGSFREGVWRYLLINGLDESSLTLFLCHIIKICRFDGTCGARKTPIMNVTYRRSDDNDALFELAKKYDDANEDEKALPILENLADKGHAMAQSYLGMYYECGFAGLEVNIEKAFDLYLKSAEQGCADAMVNLGDLYISGNLLSGTNYEKAIEWYEKARELGLPDALVAIGELYRDGQGYEKDLQKAYDCFSEAFEIADEADKGTPSFLIGCLLEETEQYEEAFEYYEQAASFGINEALVRLGVLCHLSLGVEKNENRAFEFFMQAYDKGVESVARWLGDAYRYGYGTEENNDKAIQFYEEAIENGDAYAMVELGRMYLDGIGCEKSWKKAYDLFNKAAELGNDDALEALSYFYDEGGVLENKDELQRCLLVLEKSEDDFLRNQAKMRLERMK